MPRYTYGAIDKKAKTVVEADTYRIDSGYVTFLRDDKPFLSVPFSKAPIVAELDADGELPVSFIP